MAEIRIVRRRSDSWLDPESAGLLGWRLGKRLWTRVHGREGRFISLTYDRKPYADAQDCFDRARAQKHVSRFMRKLGKLLGVSLRGKWLCKMEFQEGGWVHWHIVLVDVGFIPRELFVQIYDLWGHGSIHVKPLTEENCRYLTKYVAKDGTIPGFVYSYPSGSIKVVRPSLGFWNDERAAKARERTATRATTPAEFEAAEAAKEKAAKGKAKPDYYVPIGAKLSGYGTEVRAFKVNDAGKVVEHRTMEFVADTAGDCSAPGHAGVPTLEFRHALVSSLRRRLGEPESCSGGYVFKGDAEAVREAWSSSWKEALSSCVHACTTPRVERFVAAAASTEPPGQDRSAAAAAVDRGPWAGATAHRVGQPLFLRGHGKRAQWWRVFRDGRWHWYSPADLVGPMSAWWAKHAPWWVKLWWEQEARYDAGMSMHGEWGWPPDAVVSVSA